ncbi:hypothetical protein F0562_014602 [Nyssa sinensis]|uniref:AAA+ ATPase domain-containing protein n=1 Tax=Nyssa sinensis TaxID=561372 RepID=A0A5J4ZRH8_9ASTE|nr:hypothetical protein F0562_014602 [Nyssa sinensis]
MPSPAISRSKSAPNISNSDSSQYPSNQSSLSANYSPKATAWPKKVGDYIKRKSSKQPALTEEFVEELNRRNEILHEKKDSTTSPYYRGLTDQTLAIYRQRLLESSPGRESHTTNSNSITSFVVKMQEWSTAACFGFLGILNEKGVNKVTKERTFVLAEKYRPTALKDFICNREKAIELQALAKSETWSHFIFGGLPGVGKRTMILALLREAFGPDSLQGEGVGSIQVLVKESLQHIEINISDLKGYEKHVIVELIKEANSRSYNKAWKCSRAIILYEADKLSTDALSYIRWMLERFRGCHKVFFCCNEVSRLQPIKSLCTVVELLPPSSKEIIEVLEFIAKQEGIELPGKLAENIANKSNNNLRQTIRSFEATWHSNSPLKEDQEIMTGWEDDIANIAKNTIEEQSPKQLYIIRGKLQNLIEHNVSPDFIFESLVEELRKRMDKDLQEQTQIDSLYEEYIVLITD